MNGGLIEAELYCSHCDRVVGGRLWFPSDLPDEEKAVMLLKWESLNVLCGECSKPISWRQK